MRGLALLPFLIVNGFCCPSLSEFDGYFELRPCQGEVQISTATGIHVVDCDHLGTFMFYGVGFVEKDGCNWKVLGHTPCRDHDTIRVRKAMGCETFLDDFIIGFASGAAVFFSILMISAFQRIRELRKLKAEEYSTRFSICRTGLKYHSVPLENGMSDLISKSGLISWKTILLCILALKPCPTPACVMLKELSTTANTTNYIADLWPGQHICVGGEMVRMKEQEYGHVMKTMYYTASWSFSESEPESWCIAVGCQEKSCGTTFGEVVHVKNGTMITNFCEQSPWNQGLCWTGGGCLYYTTKIKIDVKRPWAVRLGSEGTPMKLAIDGTLSSCEIRRLGGKQARAWSAELTLLTSESANRSYLCPTTASRGFPREAMLGDLQSPDKEFKKPMLARNSFKCNLDQWKGKLKCFYKTAYIDSVAQDCKELPAEIDGVSYVMTSPRAIVVTSVEPVQVMVSCSSDVAISQRNVDCTILSSDLYGVDGSGFGLHAVITTTTSVGSSIPITSDCLTSPWVISCDEPTHVSPPIASTSCSFNNISSISHIIDADHLSSVRILESSRSWTGSWIGFGNLKWPSFLSGLGSPLLLLLAAVLLLRR